MGILTGSDIESCRTGHTKIGDSGVAIKGLRVRHGKIGESGVAVEGRPLHGKTVVPGRWTQTAA